MTCPCENKCAGKNPPAILAVEQPCEPVLFHRVDYPANLGDDTTVDVNTLDYRNVLLVFANQHAYLYSSDGIPTFISLGDFSTEAIEQKLAELGIQLADETTARTQADETLEDSIAANSNEIVEIKTEINQINQTQSENFEQLNNTLSGLENQTVQKDTGVSGDNSTITITKKLGALGSNDTTETGLPLPVASETSAGVMNAATYASVQTNAENIDSILNGAVLVEGLPASPTQDELTMQWKAETGKTMLVNRASIYDKTNGKIWYYYTNVNEWEPADIQNPEITVSQATNEALGIVKGSTEDGQVAVEADGSMSLNGYDTLNSSVENLSDKVDGIEVPKLYNYVVGTNTSGATWGAYSEGSAGATEPFLRYRLPIRNINTGDSTFAYLQINIAEATGDKTGVKAYGLMPNTSKAKLDSLLAIKTLNDSLTLSENGELSVVGGGSDVNLLNEYTASPAEGDVYNAEYVNERLNGSQIYIGSTASGTTGNQQTNYSIAIGDNAIATNNNVTSVNGAIAIGHNASNTSGTGAIAIGYNASTFSSGIAIGQNSRLRGGSSGVVIGDSARDTSSSTSTTGHSAVVAIGNGAQALGNYDVVIGATAKGGSNGYGVAIGHAAGTGDSKENVAIGNEATASGRHSVAIGSSAKNTRSEEFSIGGGTGSGDSVATRYLANVTAGVLPTDAVNLQQMQEYVGEQLGDVASVLETLTTGAGV